MKTTDKGLTVSTVYTCSYYIRGIYFDRTTDLLYVHASDKNGNHECHYFDLANSDTRTALGTLTTTDFNIEKRYNGLDIFVIGGVIYITSCEQGAGSIKYTRIRYWNAGGGTWDIVCEHTNSDTTPVLLNWGVIIGTNFYFKITYESAIGFDGLYKFNSVASTLTRLWFSTSYTTRIEGLNIFHDIDEVERGVIAYDEVDYLYFTIYKKATLEYVIGYYSLTGASFTEVTTTSIKLMLDRNTDSGNDPPYNLEKGFHVSNYYVYQISKNISPPQLYKIADLTHHSTPPTAALRAITDSYLITDDAQFYEYVGIRDTGEVDILHTEYNPNAPSRANIGTDRIYTTGESISLYDISSGAPVLAFHGKAVKKIVRQGVRSYECESYDSELFTTKFTKDYTGLGLTSKEIIEDILDTFAHYHWYDANIDPDGDFAAVREPNFVNRTFAEAFDILMDKENGAWTRDQEGEIYAWHITNIPATGKTVYRTSTPTDSGHIIGFPPDIDEIMEQINKIMLYGQMDNSTGLRLQTGTGHGEDLESQLADGIVEYVDYYASIADQTELDDLSDDLLNRIVNPMYIDTLLQSIGFQVLFKTINFQFDPISELAVAVDYYINSYKMDLMPDNPQLEMRLSSGLIQYRRKEITEQKVSASDEEQIDVVATGVATVGAAFAAHIAETTTAHGGIPDAITDLVENGNWKVFYSDGSGDGKEVAVGASATVFAGNGVAAAPSFQALTTLLAGFSMTVSGNYTGDTTAAWRTIYTVPTGYTAKFVVVYWERSSGSTYMGLLIGGATYNVYVATDAISENRIQISGQNVQVNGSSGGNHPNYNGLTYRYVVIFSKD